MEEEKAKTEVGVKVGQLDKAEKTVERGSISSSRRSDKTRHGRCPPD